MMKILLAIDSSEYSEVAIDEIARQYFPGDSEVRVISVVEPPQFPEAFSGGGMNMSFYVEINNTASKRASAAVEKAAVKLREGDESRKLKITTEVLSGSPKRVILVEAEAFGGDLIIVGSHGDGPLERFVLGSVSQAVALQAKCSVEIVRRSECKPHQP